MNDNGLRTSVHYKPTDSHSICCIHHPTHPMSKIPFPILNLDSDVCAVMTLIFLTNLKKCASFSKNVANRLL